MIKRISTADLLRLKDISFESFIYVFKAHGYYTVAASGCWEWQGMLSDRGYGLFGRGGVFGYSKRAHRIFYFKKHGALNPKLELAHTCHNRRCVNPEHLVQTTHRENCNMRQ